MLTRQIPMIVQSKTFPHDCNKLLDEALAQKVIEKSMRDGRTIYRPAPF